MVEYCMFKFHMFFIGYQIFVTIPKSGEHLKKKPIEVLKNTKKNFKKKLLKKIAHQQKKIGNFKKHQSQKACINILPLVTAGVALVLGYAQGV